MPSPLMTTSLNMGAPAQSEVPGSAPAIPAPYQIPGKPLATLISYSKANPTSSIANLAKQYITSGAYDQQALKEGTDLSWAGRPSLSDMQEQTKPAVEKIADTIEKPITDLASDAADKDAEQLKEAGQGIEQGVLTNAGKESAESEQGDIPAEVGTDLETLDDTASGAVQGIFAPVTGLVQAISDKLSDQGAVQDFANGNKTTGGILDLYDQLGNKINELSAAHPETAKNIGNAANILLSTMGGETEAGEGVLNADVGDAANQTVKSAAESAAQGSKVAAEAAQGAKESVINTAKGIKTGTAESAGGTIAKAAPFGKFALAQYTGLSPESIDFFAKNPEVATPEAISTASLHNLGKDVESAIGAERSASVPSPADLAGEVKDKLTSKSQELREHAFKYPTGSNSAINTEKGIVKVDPDWLRDQMQNKEIAGVDIDKEGRVTHGDADSKINPADSPTGARRMQDLWDTWGPKFATGKMTRPDFIRFRQSLAGMANYGGAFDDVLNKSADAIRSNFNKEYRSQIPGLEKLDKNHTQMTRDFEDSMKGLAVKDPVTGEIKMQDDAASRILNATKNTKDEFGQRLEKLAPGILSKVQKAKDFSNDWSKIVDENGHLKENALNDIKNSVNSGRDIRLQKLEGIMPGVTKRIQFIKAAEDYNNAMGQKVGTYVRGGLGLTLALHNPVLGIGALMTANPRAGLMVLRAIGKMSGK